MPAKGSSSAGTAAAPSMVAVTVVTAVAVGGSCRRSRHPRAVAAASSASATSRREIRSCTVRLSPKVFITRCVGAASSPRSWSVLCVVSTACSAGKACRVMVDQSWSATRVAGSSTASTSPPSALCHIGTRSYGSATEREAGPVTSEPFHASIQRPGGIQTGRVVRLCVES
eukprot:scaffold80862_cov64-Phaeocystis_antarctica.AAC.7